MANWDCCKLASLGSYLGYLIGCLKGNLVMAFTWVLSLSIVITSQLLTQGFVLPHHGEHNVRLLVDHDLVPLHSLHLIGLLKPVHLVLVTQDLNGLPYGDLGHTLHVHRH